MVVKLRYHTNMLKKFNYKDYTEGSEDIIIKNISVSRKYSLLPRLYDEDESCSAYKYSNIRRLYTDTIKFMHENKKPLRRIQTSAKRPVEDLPELLKISLINIDKFSSNRHTSPKKHPFWGYYRTLLYGDIQILGQTSFYTKARVPVEIMIKVDRYSRFLNRFGYFI